MDYCDQCGSKLYPGQVFCSDCGTTVQEEPTNELSNSTSVRIYRPPTLWLQVVIVIIGLVVLVTAVIGILTFLSNPLLGLVTVPLLVVEVWIIYNLPQYHAGARLILVLLSAAVALVSSYLIVIADMSLVFPLLLTLFIIYVLVLDHETSVLFSGKYHGNSD